MPRSEFSDELHAEKYRAPGETFKEAMTRVAGAITDNPAHFQIFREILTEQRFLPGGRNQSALGSTRNVTPYNCFVSGTIDDSFVEGKGSIMARAAEAATTMRMGGGIGYDFSTLRPRGANIKKLHSTSSGPVSFMEIFNAICGCVSSSGHRRGAQMGVLRVDHPDIEEFINSKHNENRLTQFNISIAVTDKFMQAVVDGTQFNLQFRGEVYRTVDARSLWDLIMRSTWDWGEPGLLFIDRINEMNNLWYCETIAATNPCGEQPLPPYGACLLGSFNLVKYVDPMRGSIDLEMLEMDVTEVVRAMDNVVNVATYPLFEQESEAKNKRRMGLGVTGVCNALEAIGLKYGSPEYLAMQDKILITIRDAAYATSSDLAVEKGCFPAYHPESYMMGRFFETLSGWVKDKIRRQGLRNSHLLSIAPTGTISMCADNVSSGIEPVVAYEYNRLFNKASGQVKLECQDYGLKYLGVRGTTIEKATIGEHLEVLARATRFVDSAVSKTCNVPVDYSWNEFKDVYLQAWRLGCKGITTFRLGGLRGGILEPKTCTLDPATGRKECGE